MPPIRAMTAASPTSVAPAATWSAARAAAARKRFVAGGDRELREGVRDADRAELEAVQLETGGQSEQGPAESAPPGPEVVVLLLRQDAETGGNGGIEVAPLAEPARGLDEAEDHPAVAEQSIRARPAERATAGGARTGEDLVEDRDRGGA